MVAAVGTFSYTYAKVSEDLPELDQYSATELAQTSTVYDSTGEVVEQPWKWHLLHGVGSGGGLSLWARIKRLLGLGEQVVAPFDRRPQGPLTRRLGRRTAG